VTDEEASQIDTAEMKNLNEKRKAENGIIIFIFLSTYDIVSKDKDSIKRNALI
jgi:hypothetical protein